MTLKTDLQEISGIGPAKADAILEVLERAESDSDSDSDNGDKRAMMKALRFLESGRSDVAEQVLRDQLEQ